MSSLGERVKNIRMSSPYRDLMSFAAHAGMSHEGLRKIELGERIPNRKTLDNIIDVVSLPEKEAAKLRRMRDAAHAEREGLALPRATSDEKLRQLSTRVVDTFEAFMNECEVGLPEEERKELLKRVLKLSREELRG